MSTEAVEKAVVEGQEALPERLARVWTTADLSLLDTLNVPIWMVNLLAVGDGKGRRLNRWANKEGVKFWGQSNVEGLVAKTFDLSEKHVNFLGMLGKQIQTQHEIKQYMETFHHQDPPVQVNVRVVSIRVKFDKGEPGYFEEDERDEDGATTFALTIGIPKEADDVDVDSKRIIIGTRYVQTMVSMLSMEEKPLHMNTQASEFFNTLSEHKKAGSCSALRDMFHDEADYKAVKSLFAKDKANAFKRVCRMASAEAQHEVWHNMQIIITQDPKDTKDVYVVSAVDVSEMIKIQEELQRLHQAEVDKTNLEKEREVMKELVKHKDSILAAISHEMRTPLNGIIGLSDALHDGAPDDDNKQVLATIRDSGHRLLNLVNDVLDMSKLRSDRIELVMSEFNLHEVVAHVMAVALHTRKGKDIKLVNNVGEGVIMRADKGRIEQILFNLVGNGIKFTDTGGSVTVSHETREGDEKHIITVKDTGIGIDAKNFDKIFLEFEQADSRTSRKFGGTGLGLPLSKNLVELHGGVIWVESSLNAGAALHFKIPFDPELFRWKGSDSSRSDSRSGSLKSGTNLSTASNAEVKVEVELPPGMDDHFFLSHTQATGGDQCQSLYLDLLRMGFRCWFDKMVSGNKVTKEGMREGIEKSGAFVLFLSKGVLTRDFVIFELRTALEAKKPIVFLHEEDPRHSPFDFVKDVEAAPEDLRHLFVDIESIPYRRRLWEREAMLDFIVVLASYRALKQQADVAAGKHVKLDYMSDADVAVPAEGTVKSIDPANCHILSVDDEEVNQTVVTTVLKGAGYNVSTAMNGMQAIDMIRRSVVGLGKKGKAKTAMYDLVLLDIMMPEMDGYEVLQELRTKYPKEVLPIILVSAKNTTQDVVTGFSNGCSDYVRKPYQKAELLARIRTQLLSKASWERTQLQAGVGQATNELKAKLDGISKLLVEAGVRSDAKLQEEVAASKKAVDDVIADFMEDYAKTRDELRDAEHHAEALEVATGQLQAKNRELQAQKKVRRGWKTVQVPHDFVIDGDYCFNSSCANTTDPFHGRLPKSVGWYRNTNVSLPADLEGRFAWLTFDGVYRDAMVWWNGELLARHSSGYTQFHLPLKSSSASTNVLAVRADARTNEGWFYEGGGLYRDVWLTVAPALHILPDGVFVFSRVDGPIAVAAPQGAARATATATASLNVSIDMGNSGKSTQHFTIELVVVHEGIWSERQREGAGKRNSEVEGEVEGKAEAEAEAEAEAGRVVASAMSPVYELTAGTNATFTVVVDEPDGGGSGSSYSSFVLEQANLWSPEQPHLYRLVSTIVPVPAPAPASAVESAAASASASIGASATASIGASASDSDSVNTTFGIRRVHFDATRGLLLNDSPTPINGMCMHQDMFGVGTAVPARMNAYRISSLKRMGANAWRAAHNPPSPQFLEAADRLGMLVWNENREFGTEVDGFIPTADVKANIVAMVRRDRNHPSVIVWSLCNEEGCLQRTPEEARAKGAMAKAAITSMDHGMRPMTAAINFGSGGKQCDEDCLSPSLDVIGMNYNWAQWDQYHREHPTQPMMVSEITRSLSVRGVYAKNASRGHSSAYDALQVYPGMLHQISTRAYMAGGFFWTGWDYRGEPEFPDVCVSASFGAVDIAGFEKDSFYCNAHSVELHLNGRNISRQPTTMAQGMSSGGTDIGTGNTMGMGTATGVGTGIGTGGSGSSGVANWSVAFEPGVLSATAFDARGSVLGSTKVETAGAPAALQLQVDAADGIGGGGTGGGGATPLTICADGHDVFMARVVVVDSEGRFVPTAAVEVSFAVSGAGAGRLVGTSNGDPASRESDKSSTRTSFNGLLRVAVQSSKGRLGPIELSASASAAGGLGVGGAREGAGPMQPAKATVHTVAC
eukprot:g509.t1